MSRLRSWFSGAASRLDAYVLLVVLLAVFATGPLLQPGYFWDAHDARHSVYFLFEFDRGIQDGDLYPRWQPDFAFGYGYPFFNIYGPLSTYAAEVFHLLGAGFTGAVKTVFGLSIVASGLAMYGFVRRLMGRPAGLVAAVAYMYIPYRFVDVYVRAALAESVAYVFVPLVLWGVWATLHRPRLANVLGLALAYAALMFTHPLTALLLTLILVFFVAALALARVNDRQPLRRMSRESLLPLAGHIGHVLVPTAAGLILGLGLSALFALPAMTENRFVRVDQWYGGRYAWGGDFVEFFQLFSPRWGFGTSVPGPDDQVSFQLGAVPAVLSLLGAAFVLLSPGGRRRREGSRIAEGRQVSFAGGTRVSAFFAVLLVVVILLMLSVSAPLWEALPLARLAQFPWRLLSLTVVSMAILCGAVASQFTPAPRSSPASEPKMLTQSAIPGRRALGSTSAVASGPAVLVLVALLILGSLPYVQAEMSQQEVSLAGLMRFQQSSDEMTGSTAWVREIPRWSPMADFFIAGEPLTSKIDYNALYRQPGRVQARTLELHVESELVEYSAQRPILLTFNTFYYPGWHAYLVDTVGRHLEELPIALRGELGLMTVSLPAGVGRVLLQFEDTPLRKVATLVSWASLGLVGILIGTRWALKRRTALGSSPRGAADPHEEPRAGAATTGERRKGSR